METFRHILFPVDFSAQCRTVIPFVKAMAGKFHAKVTLMHVIEFPLGGYWAADGAYPITYDLPALAADATNLLNNLWDNSPDCPAQKVIEEGDASTTIVEYAAENGIDLIMLPTHGNGPFRRLLLGSVTAKVLHDAKCAVWTAAHCSEATKKHLSIRNILCAIDLSPSSEKLLCTTARLAADLEAKPLVVHAIPGALYQSTFTAGDEFRRFLLDTAEREAANLQKRAGTSIEAIFQAGGVADTVRSIALDRQADLVVIGRGRLHETLGGLRSNAYSIIREAPCPVVSFPEPPPESRS